MKKTEIKSTFRKLKKNIIGFAFTLTSTLSVSFGASLFFSNKIDFGSNMANVIRCNNMSEEKTTYWRCEPIESRLDWLGWGVKSYLTSLANPWAVYGDQNNNNCFLYTDSSLEQSFIKKPNSDELIPVSIFASPSSRSLSCFNIKLKDNKIVDTKNNFYCSEYIADILNNNLENQSLIVKCGSEQINSVTFSGVVESFGNDFINRFIGSNKNFIIVPYTHQIEDKNEIISYDMRRFTGQSTFYALLKNDRYENNYYSLMIDSIYQMGGVKGQLCYKATYIDSFDDLFKTYNLIDSKVQANYLRLVNSTSKNTINLAIGIVLIICGVALLSVLIWQQNKKKYSLTTFSSIIASSLSLIIFWIIGEILYYSNVTLIIFWDIGGRIFSLILTLILTTLFIIISRHFNNDRHKGSNNLEYYSIDI